MAYPRLCVRGPPWNAQVPRAPLPNAGFPTLGSCHASPRKALPFVIARTGSCAEPIPFPSLWSNLVLLIFAGCYRPLLAIGPSRRYLCESFPRCLGPYHDGLQVALTCYFPCSIGLPQKEHTSAYREIPLKRLHSGGNFRGCSHFVMFRPLSLLATLVAPNTTVSCRAVCDFYVRARLALLPPQAPDMLAVRNR